MAGEPQDWRQQASGTWDEEETSFAFTLSLVAMFSSVLHLLWGSHHIDIGAAAIRQTTQQVYYLKTNGRVILFM